ncbi:MAG: hypothetical protein R2847_10060 [Bacteroidia bacterium]
MHHSGAVHFRGSRQGSRLALPIFAKMMEKAYKDKKSGVTTGKSFVKPKTRIKKEYYCDMEDYDIAGLDSLQLIRC